MNQLFYMVKRNVKLYVKDRGLFFASLMTPIILLILYVTFLSSIYKVAFTSQIPEGIEVSSKLVNGIVGAQLLSSLLAVSAVTVSFCSSIIMVQDKYTGVIKDIHMTPTKKSTITISYYLSTLINSLLVCYVAMGLCLIYIAFIGWFFTIVDILLLMVDVLLLAMFGSAFAILVNSFLTSQGQVSAISTIVSAGYGFVCGAYMPISQFSTTLQNVAMFLPGTYGTSLIREHSMNSILSELGKTFPSEVIVGIKESMDIDISFFNNSVNIAAKYLVLIGATILLLGIHVLIQVLKKDYKKR